MISRLLASLFYVKIVSGNGSNLVKLKNIIPGLVFMTEYNSKLYFSLEPNSSDLPNSHSITVFKK